MAAIQIPGITTGSAAAVKRENAAKPTVDKPDAAFVKSALENGFNDIEAELVMPDGSRLPVKIAMHGFKTGTLGWQGRLNTVCKITTGGGATRNLRLSGDFKVYIGGSGEVVKQVCGANAAATGDDDSGEL
jgi:hypothetical protein